MQQLASNNYEYIQVYLKGDDKPIEMPVKGGVALMNYLTTLSTSSHVKLTDRSGVEMVISKHEIKMVTPVNKRQKLTTDEIDDLIRKMEGE